MAYPAGGGYGGGSGYSYRPAPQGVNFGWIGEAWAVFRTNPWAWVGAQLLAVVLVVALEVVLILATGVMGTIFNTARRGVQPDLLAMPGYWAFIVLLASGSSVIVGGLFRMAYRHARGEYVTAVDFLSLGDVFAPLLIYGFMVSGVFGIPGALLGAMMGKNPILCIPIYILVLLAQSFLLFVPLAIVGDRLNPIAAIGKAVQVIRPHWLMMMLYVLVLGLVAGLGVIACFVGMLATYPIYFIGMAIAYIRLSEGATAPQMGYGETAPGTWPPAPGSQAVQGTWPSPPGSLPPASFGAPRASSPGLGQPGYGQPPPMQQPSDRTPPIDPPGPRAETAARTGRLSKDSDPPSKGGN